jgi:hypothetical protein
MAARITLSADQCRSLVSAISVKMVVLKASDAFKANTELVGPIVESLLYLAGVFEAHLNSNDHHSLVVPAPEVEAKASPAALETAAAPPVETVTPASVQPAPAINVGAWSLRTGEEVAAAEEAAQKKSKKSTKASTKSKKSTKSGASSADDEKEEKAARKAAEKKAKKEAEAAAAAEKKQKKSLKSEEAARAEQERKAAKAKAKADKLRAQADALLQATSSAADATSAPADESLELAEINGAALAAATPVAPADEDESDDELADELADEPADEGAKKGKKPKSRPLSRMDELAEYEKQVRKEARNKEADVSNRALVRRVLSSAVPPPDPNGSRADPVSADAAQALADYADGKGKAPVVHLQIVMK